MFCVLRNVVLSSLNRGCAVCCKNASFEVRSVRSHSCPFITRTYRYELPTRADKNGVCGDSTNAWSPDFPKKSLQHSSLQCSSRGQQQEFFGCLVLAKAQYTPLVHRSSSLASSAPWYRNIRTPNCTSSLVYVLPRMLVHAVRPSLFDLKRFQCPRTVTYHPAHLCMLFVRHPQLRMGSVPNQEKSASPEPHTHIQLPCAVPSQNPSRP